MLCRLQVPGMACEQARDPEGYVAALQRGPKGPGKDKGGGRGVGDAVVEGLHASRTRT